MAQSKDKRRQRANRRPQAAAVGPTPEVAAARQRRRRVVIAFLVIVGLAGILAVSSPDGDGAPAGGPGSASADER